MHNEIIFKLLSALTKAKEHLDYCGYGNEWERECADAINLEEEINTAIEFANANGYTQ